MRKTSYVFIDAGMHEGQSTEAFLKSKTASEHEWNCFAFEPEPRLFQKASKKLQNKSTCFEQAVWTKDETLSFFTGKNDQSSTLMHGKTTGNLDYTKPISVKAIDFSAWIKRTFDDQKDFIILKMDIEGAEYDVLEKMLTDDTLKYINILFIEWHWQKLKGFDRQRHVHLVDKLKSFLVVTEDQVHQNKWPNWFTALSALPKVKDAIKCGK